MLVGVQMMILIMSLVGLLLSASKSLLISVVFHIHSSLHKQCHSYGGTQEESCNDGDLLI